MPSPRRFLTAAACIAGAMCGCQSPQSPQATTTLPPAAPPAPVAAQATASAESTATAPAEAAPSAPALSPAEAVARQAEQHAAAIEALLNARQTEDAKERGVKIVDASKPPEPAPAPQIARADPARAQASLSPAPAMTEVRFEKPSSDTPAVIPAPSNTGIADPSNGSNTNSAAAAEPVKLPDGTLFKTAGAKPTDATEGLAPKVATSGSLELALAKRAREYPRDLASQLDNQLLLFLKDQAVPDAQALGSLTQEDRDVLTALMDGLSNFRNAVRDDNNMLMNRKIRPLVEMSERLRARSDLSVPQAMLCKEVKGFGLYTPIDPPRFEGGVTHPVIVYCEIDNFSSQVNDKQLWETKLDQEIVLYTETGLPVWNDKKTQYTDASRNRRRDFFVNKIITLPANLTFGRYVLKVTMTDVHANRVAETSIPISVVAK